jgi:transcription initiation factor TFIIH subunit 4
MASCTSLVDFLAKAQPAKVDTLYLSRWTCSALLRSLPPLAKQLVLRLLHVEVAFSAAELQSWARPEQASPLAAAIQTLLSLRVLLADAAQRLSLHPAFRDSVLLALRELRPPPPPELPPALQRLAPSEAQLEALCREKWERLLLFLACDTLQPPDLAPGCTLDVAVLLQSAGLRVTVEEAAAAEGKSVEEFCDSEELPEEGSFTTSAAGFRFLLLDRPAQLWQFLQHYVAQGDAVGGGGDQLLALLLRLSFLPACVPQLAPDEPAWRALLGDMGMLGLVYVFPQQPGDEAAGVWYCVTPLAASVAAGLAAEEGAASAPQDENCEPGSTGNGHIIVEVRLSHRW